MDVIWHIAGKLKSNDNFFKTHVNWTVTVDFSEKTYSKGSRSPDLNTGKTDLLGSNALMCSPSGKPHFPPLVERKLQRSFLLINSTAYFTAYFLPFAIINWDSLRSR